jgi:hypothetical protein
MTEHLQRVGRAPGRKHGKSPSCLKWEKGNKKTVSMQSKYSFVYPYLIQFLKDNNFKGLHSDHIIDLLGKLNSKEIVIVSGTYDHIENICNQSDIPYTLISVEEILTHEFVDNTILFCNCISGEYPSEQTTLIRQLMDSNIINTLVTTDWCGTNVLKGVLGSGNVTKIGTTGDCHCVEVNCSEYNMTFAMRPASWWLESSSYIVKINGSVPFMTASEDMSYTQDTVQEFIKKPNLSFKKTLDSGAVVIHFTSHLELQKKQDSSKYDGIAIKDFIENELHLEYKADIEKKITVAEFHAIFTSLMALMGVFADHYIRTPLPSIPETSVVSEVDSKKMLFIYGLTSLNQQFDTKRLALEQTVQELCDSINDIEFILDLAHKLRFKYNLTDFPMIILKWCIQNNSKQPETKRTILRIFCKTRFKLSIRDFINLYEKCHYGFNIPKILQKIMNDRVNDFTPEDFRKYQGSVRYSDSHPIAPRKMWERIIKASHPKPTAAINMFLKVKDSSGVKMKLPMVNTVITEKSSGKDPKVFLPELIAEGKLSFVQMIKNLNDLLTCDLETQSWVIQELHNVEKIKRSKVMISNYLNAIKEHSDPRIVSGLDNAFKIMTSSYIPDGMDENIGIYIDGTCSMNKNNLLSKALAIGFAIYQKYPNTEIIIINDTIQPINIENLKDCAIEYRTTIGLTATPDTSSYNHVIWISDNSSWVNIFKGEHKLTYIDLTGQLYYDPEVTYMPGSEYMNLELINGY